MAEEHVDLAFDGGELADIDLDVADPVSAKRLSLLRSLLVSGLVGDAVPFPG